jgi:flagellum-specific peptidoglycan hydrolase FlgJ
MAKQLLKQLMLKFICAVFLLLSCFFSNSQTAYVKQYRPVADSLANAYGIPAAVILGVAIIESSSGSSRNCKLLNNHFGIVGKNTAYKRKKIKTRYKQYINGKSSYIDFCNIISRKKFYKKLKGNLNFHLWVDAISKAGYSEVPSVWKQRVTGAILNNHLQ